MVQQEVDNMSGDEATATGEKDLSHCVWYSDCLGLRESMRREHMGQRGCFYAPLGSTLTNGVTALVESRHPDSRTGFHQAELFHSAFHILAHSGVFE